MHNDPLDPSRGNAQDETRLLETRPPLPVPRSATPPAFEATDATVPIPRPATSSEPEVLLRFGPGVPTAGRRVPEEDERRPSPGRRWRAVNVVLTIALALVVLWLLWPSPPIAVRQATVRAPAVVSCGSSADVVATLRTNGRSGTVRYRWVRNDGVTSDVLTASLPSGRSATDVHLRWTFTGPGTYAAEAGIEVLEPQATRATTSFAYRC